MSEVPLCRTRLGRRGLGGLPTTNGPGERERERPGYEPLELAAMLSTTDEPAGIPTKGPPVWGLEGLPKMIDSGRGNTPAEDAQGTPTQSCISPSILVYEDERGVGASQEGRVGLQPP